MTAQDGVADGGYYGSQGWPALMSAAQGFHCSEEIDTQSQLVGLCLMVSGNTVASQSRKAQWPNHLLLKRKRGGFREGKCICYASE